MATTDAFEQLQTEIENVEPMTRRERWTAFVTLWVVAPLRVMWQDRRTRYGAVIILFYILMGTLGIVLVEAPRLNEGPPWLGAFQTMEFPFGTNVSGEDLLAKTVHATDEMLLMALAGGVFTTAVGVVVGTLAGYKRGATERILMTASDVQMAIPGLPLLIVLTLALQPHNAFVIGILLSVDAWPGLARSLHSQVLALRSESYVEASRIMAIGSPTIIRDDILPNVMPYIMINFMTNTVRVIHASVALYFLGVLPFTTQNWGVMLNYAYNKGALLSMQGLHWLLVPILAITLLSYGVTIFSQGMDRLFNPRVRARHAKGSDEAATALNE